MIDEKLIDATMPRKNMNISYSIPYVCTERIFDSRPFLCNEIFLKDFLKNW